MGLQSAVLALLLPVVLSLRVAAGATVISSASGNTPPQLALERRRALMLPLLLMPVPASAVGQEDRRGMPRRPVGESMNEADLKFMELVEASVQKKEAKLGFKLDDESRNSIESMMRGTYCGPQGLSAGWALPGGPCADLDPCSLTSYRGDAGACAVRPRR